MFAVVPPMVRSTRLQDPYVPEWPELPPSIWSTGFTEQQHSIHAPVPVPALPVSTMAGTTAAGNDFELTQPMAGTTAVDNNDVQLAQAMAGTAAVENDVQHAQPIAATMAAGNDIQLVESMERIAVMENNVEHAQPIAATTAVENDVQLAQPIACALAVNGEPRVAGAASIVERSNVLSPSLVEPPLDENLHQIQGGHNHPQECSLEDKAHRTMHDAISLRPGAVKNLPDSPEPDASYTPIA
jgi:hypothetical protein